MLLKIDLLIREANKRKLQCAFFSVGVDYPGTIISRFFLTRIFKCLPAEHIYVRDITSNTVYAHINKKNRKTARVVSDAAFYAYDTSSSVHADQLIVGMAPQSYRTLSKKIKREHLHDNRWWCELTKQLIHLGAQPILFSNGVQSDHDRCEKIHYDLIQEGVHISLLPKPETTDQLREQLMGMSSILVQRLHLSIAYFALGGNPASLGWHSKVEDFYSSMGLKDRFLGEEKTSVVIVAKLLCDKAEKPPMQIAKLRQNLRENAESLMRTISRSTISTHNG
ncbi:MAG: polysaccharide pyruvyl transferase family protein [Porticoccaceae bacterium]